MIGYVVCVDYDDFLSITIRHNIFHFDKLVIVTTPSDIRTIRLADQYNCYIHTTNAFYENGADFNKWLALEEALDRFGRNGWICVFDADIVMPSSADFSCLQVGRLYGARRRMWYDYSGEPIPDCAEWYKFPEHPYRAEIAGYLQIFHSDDPCCKILPWYETNWRHAGGADSMFQARWSDVNKVFLPFHVLHLGVDGRNWCGRVTDRIDGIDIIYDKTRYNKLRSYIDNRMTRGFAAEKL